MYLPMYNEALPVHQVKISIPEKKLSIITPSTLGAELVNDSLENEQITEQTAAFKTDATLESRDDTVSHDIM
jgi:hypothetical protein